MEFIFRFFSEQGVIAFLQLAVGKWAKNQPWFSNKLIPVLTWLCAVLGFTLLPASSQAASFGAVLPLVGNVFGFSLMQNFLVTGVHSSFKNTVIPAFWGGINRLAKISAAKLAQKAGEKQLED